MRKSTTYAIALALILDTIMIAAASIDYTSSAAPATTPQFGTHGRQTPLRAGKSDRLDGRPEIRRIAGVTVVLRDIDPVVR